MSIRIIEEDTGEVRRGPWTVEEDALLTHYIATHGLGTWNTLAKCAGLKRTGKSCRLRWLNYLKPDIKRGNLSLEEQILILELHSKWGNRWSKIAEHLPGRTDNEIKNYWRTKVQKPASSSSSSSSSLKQTSSQVSVPSQLVPSFSTFSTSVPTDFINIPDQQTSTNVVYDQVLNGSYHIGLDSEYVSAAAEGIYCNEMTATLWPWE